MEYVYAALLLHKLGKEVSEEHLRKVIESAGAGADETQIKSLVASLKGVDIDKELENATLAMSSAPAPAGSHEHAAKKEEPKEEKHESAAEGLSALFG
ncbi:MAG: 50S ribosomal protein P1 [Candidatus Pacearchaeota archaeon]|nr:50S ribosomal protein P1 [Candidatus Pacearchaeota archaeon]MDE1848602.1 50S ribosomal protein P1 [Nanoarchaeota archaeon]